jgi:multidrug transporter EmrE-like cation transporter
MWIRLILVAFVTNGLGAFGLRILAGMGLAGRYNFHYLVGLYGGGAIVGALAYFRQNPRPYRRELVITAGMAACSVLGQMGIMLALQRGLPGFVVFPVCVGGGMLLVLAAAVLLFRERLTLAGYLGIGVGFASLVLLALP